MLPVLGKDVTLYQLGPDAPSATHSVIREGDSSLTIKPVGIDKDSGQTIYIAKEYQSKVVYRNAIVTTTLVATPTTNTCPCLCPQLTRLWAEFLLALDTLYI